jgi:hypothetical protein
MAAVLTAAFRRLESFLINECQRTILPLKREQLKSIIFVLLHSKCELLPLHHDYFLKFITLSYNLNDVTITQQEAVDLYVDVAKHIHGKNVTMEAIETKWLVQNTRDQTAKPTNSQTNNQASSVNPSLEDEEMIN